MVAASKQACHAEKELQSKCKRHSNIQGTRNDGPTGGGVARSGRRQSGEDSDVAEVLLTLRGNRG